MALLAGHGEQRLALGGVSRLFRERVKLCELLRQHLYLCLREQRRKILGFLHLRAAVRFAPTCAAEQANQTHWRTTRSQHESALIIFSLSGLKSAATGKYVAAIEVRANLRRRPFAIPDAELAQPPCRTLAGRRPGNAHVLELLWGGLGIVGVEFAILVDTEH